MPEIQAQGVGLWLFSFVGAKQGLSANLRSGGGHPPEEGTAAKKGESLREVVNLKRCLLIALALVLCGIFAAAGAMADAPDDGRMAAIAGTYRYEGDGFGGDFTITLNADGSYTFCEGYLSSYMGMGGWIIADDGIRMTEGDAGYDLSFAFGVEEDALIYLADGSDSFLYVELPDRARFVRLRDADHACTGKVDGDLNVSIDPLTTVE